MKQLLLVRHAKSSWDDPSMTDFDRPLNERGKKNAPEMAIRLHDKGLRPDLLVSSPAKRAKQTAKAFASVFGLNDVQFLDRLYHPATAIFLEVIQSLPEHSRMTAIFSHNPGITDFANMLSGFHIDNIPTSGIVGVQADIQSWSDFDPSSSKFWFFDYPKSNH